jgi:hypothetical protein
VPISFQDQAKLILLDKLAIGIVVLIAAFVLNRLLEKYKVQQAREKEIEMLEVAAARQYLQRQVEELYSPLFGFIQRAQQLYNIARAKVPSLDGTRTATAEEAEIWRWFVEAYFLPINKQIGELIRSKIYLLENGQLPESFERFFQHETQFECLHRLWQEKRVTSESIVGAGWPKDLQSNVQETLQRLRAHHEMYAQKVVRPSTGAQSR